jgi:hypothetical protein
MLAPASYQALLGKIKEGIIPRQGIFYSGSLSVGMYYLPRYVPSWGGLLGQKSQITKPTTVRYRLAYLPSSYQQGVAASMHIGR